MNPGVWFFVAWPLSTCAVLAAGDALRRARRRRRTRTVGSAFWMVALGLREQQR